jgi:serine/threonine protein kinase
MKQATFLEHYLICTNENGSPHEVSRIGAAINYKAVDTRSNEPVLLQLIPLATVDRAGREQFEERVHTAQKLDHVNIARIFEVGVEDEYFCLVSEYLEGETADSWIAAHGLMPVDAVLRIGLQVVRAMAAAAFFSLTHRAIQPSNLMIVPGQSPDGGWPFVKLMNFGLAGLELHSASGEARELAPPVAPQFASPEQRLNGEIDFRSEVYSLGATLCFLLVGTVPLAVGEGNVRWGPRRLPELRRAPIGVRNLLAWMLRENPEQRPQDPVAFEGELRSCLTKIEKRQAIGRKLGIPLATVIPGKPREIKEPRLPLAQVLRGTAVFAALALAATALGAYFFPSLIPIWHRTEKIGVEVGVPYASPAAPGGKAIGAPVIVKQPVTNPVPTQSQNPASNVQQTQTETAQSAPPSSPANESSPAASASVKIASAANASGPATPSEGPGNTAAVTESPGPGENDSLGQTNAGSPSATENHPGSHSKQKRSASTSSHRSTARHPRTARSLHNELEWERRPHHYSGVRTRFVGTTPDGRLILLLPSGRTIIVTPRRSQEDAIVPPPYRRMYIPRPPMFPPPPPSYPYD